MIAYSIDDPARLAALILKSISLKGIEGIRAVLTGGVWASGPRNRDAS
jgi:hypothetical protein